MFGVCKRLCSFLDTVAHLDKRHKMTQETKIIEGDAISFKECQVITPTGNVLVNNLTFSLEQGHSLLLTGHNGAGKSSIFRVLGGLWPTPVGVVSKPGGGDDSQSSQGLHQSIFYLPQKPYNVLGSLRDNICYPGDDSSSVAMTDAHMRELLSLVQLEHLLDWSTEDEDGGGLIKWEERLSLGEQQRLAMVRLFFHHPNYAILDECTSAVSTEIEELLYTECNRRKITYAHQTVFILTIPNL